MAIPLPVRGQDIGNVRINPYNVVESPAGGTIGDLQLTGSPTPFSNSVAIENVLAGYQVRALGRTFEAIGLGSARVHNEIDIYDYEIVLEEIVRRNAGSLPASDAAQALFTGPQLLTLWQVLHLPVTPVALTLSHVCLITIVSSSTSSEVFTFNALFADYQHGPATKARLDGTAIFRPVDDSFRTVAARAFTYA